MMALQGKVLWFLFFFREAYVHTKFYSEADTTMLFRYHVFMAGSSSQAQIVFILLSANRQYGKLALLAVKRQDHAVCQFQIIF